MKLWKALTAGLITVIIISVIVFNLDWKIGSNLTGGCLVLDSMSMRQLNAKVKSLYLVSAKLFPIVNSCYTGHWSVIVKTDIGSFNISTARYMSIYVYPVYKHDIFSFDGNGKCILKFAYVNPSFPIWLLSLLQELSP